MTELSFLSTCALGAACLVWALFLCATILVIYGLWLVIGGILAYALGCNERDARKARIKVGALILFLTLGCKTPDTGTFRTAGRHSLLKQKAKDIPACTLKTPYCIVNHNWGYTPCATNAVICRELLNP